MKKALSIILSSLLITGMFIIMSVNASALNGTVGNCTWTLDNDVLTISGNGDIGDYSYYGNNKAPWHKYSAGSSIKKVIINNGVTGIGKQTFYLQGKIADVSIGNTVTEIREAAFYHNLALPRIVFPDSVQTIGKYAFQYCPKLTEVKLGESVTTIEEDAFYQCDKLKSVTIPASVTSIGKHAFGYTLMVGSSTYSKMNFTISGYNNTEAERYAKQNGFTFISLGDANVEPTVPPTEPTTIDDILGDADSDGSVTVLDATAIQRVLADLSAENYNETAADADGDKAVTILDATAIQRHLAGLSAPEGIGKPYA